MIPVSQSGSQRLRTESDLNPHQIALAGGLKVNTAPLAADVLFQCKYPMTIDLESAEYDVSNVIVDGRTVGSSSGKFDFRMILNDGNDFSNNLLGTPLKVEVSWTLSSFGDAFFYLSSCSIHQGEQSVALVIDGCFASKLSVSPLIQTNRLVNFTFKTFTMETASNKSQVVKCTAVVCVPGLDCSKVLTGLLYDIIKFRIICVIFDIVSNNEKINYCSYLGDSE